MQACSFGTLREGFLATSEPPRGCFESRNECVLRLHLIRHLDSTVFLLLFDRKLACALCSFLVYHSTAACLFQQHSFIGNSARQFGGCAIPMDAITSRLGRNRKTHYWSFSVDSTARLAKAFSGHLCPRHFSTLFKYRNSSTGPS